MNSRELQDKLVAEGCIAFWIPPWDEQGCVGQSQWMGVDVLECINGIWTIYFTERGNAISPDFESASEEEACDHYYKKIISLAHSHLVGNFENEINALNFQTILENANIKYRAGVGPPIKSGGKKIFSISVTGKDIFKVRELYVDLPIKDYEYTVSD